MARPLTAGLLHRPGNPGVEGKLLAKSLEAYLLALETINRLTITYRIETFCALVCNAWELLLKAKILEDAHETGASTRASRARQREAIYRPPRDGEKRRKTLSLSDCLPRVFLNEHDPIRRNLARVEELRDEAIHLFIGDVPNDVLGLLQACVLNYRDALHDWFEVTLSERVAVGMMTIVFDTDPERLDLGNPIMRRKLGKEAAEYLLSLSQGLKDEQGRLGYADQFSVEIKYSLHLQKEAEGAAVLAVTRDDGTPTSLVHTPKDPADTWPYRQAELIKELNARLSPTKRLGSGDVQAVVVAHGVKKRSEWFFQSKVPSTPGQYSKSFVDWFVTRYRQDDQFLPKSRRAWREARASMRGRE